MTTERYLYAGAFLLAVGVAFGIAHPTTNAQATKPVQFPRYRVDPLWPKPLPNPTDAQGVTHQWVTGEVGATCIDSRDHIITANRSFQRNGLLNGPTGPQEGVTSIPAAPIIEYDPEGNVVNSWGDPTLTPRGQPAVLPGSVHGCFVDYQDNIWLAGNGDGVVQKWTHD